MKASEVFEALRLLIAAHRPGFIWGPPGVGKSDVVRQIASSLKYKLVDVRAVLLDPVDLRGLPVVEDGIAKWVPPAFLPTKGKVILFLDELNAAPPLVQAACYQLILDRKLGEYELPKDCVVIAAGNRETDRAVTSRMPSALANRLIHINFDVDLDTWIKWALENEIATELIAFLRYRPGLLHSFDPQRNDKAFPTPRAWAFVNDLLRTSAQIGPDLLTYDLVSGTVGDGAAAEFMGFLKIYRNLPDPDVILMAPAKAQVPDDPATLYAVSGAIAQRATVQNMDRVVEYAYRLPPEFSVLMMRDATNRDNSLAGTRAFVEWGAKNADVLM